MSNKKSSLYYFEGFSLDADEKCLRFAEEIVSLTPKAYDTLLVLVRQSGRMVEKETLLAEIWPDTYVEESTLAQNILTLRKALRRYKKDTQFIATVPSRGYRFVANVEEIFSRDEALVVEKHTRTTIVAEQRNIHDSGDSPTKKAAIPFFTTTHRMRFRLKVAGVCLLGIAVIVVGFASVIKFSKPNFADSKFQKFGVSSLVSGADIYTAVLSPNAKYVAIVTTRGGDQALTLRQIENGNSIDLIAQMPGKFVGATFSPDGEQIFYSVSATDHATGQTFGSLYKVPLLGGASQQILKDIDSPPAVSPDNRRIAFMRQYVEKKETAVVVVDIDGKNERVIASRSVDEGFTKAGPAWSPDGKLLSCTVSQLEGGSKSIRVAVLAADSGQQVFLSRNNWLWAGTTAWLKDGSGIVTVAYGARSPNLNDEIWLVAYPEGKERSLTSGINGIRGISVDVNSNSILAVRSNKITSFTTASLSALEISNPLITKTGDDSLFQLGANWTPDGQIIYSSTQNGNADIWMIKAGGGQPKLLTSDESVENGPSITSDGQSMFFLSNRSGVMSVWRAKADGTNPEQITNKENVTDAIVSPDGGIVFFIAKATDTPDQVLWKFSIIGNEKNQMTSYFTYAPRISRDGKMIACYLFDPLSRKMRLTLLDAGSGEIISRLNSPPSEIIPLFDWMDNGENLLLILRQNNSSALWKLNVNENNAKKLHEWHDDRIFRFAVSIDGESVFLEKGVETNSVILLNDLSRNE